MKKKAIWLSLTWLMVISLVLASCAKTSTSTTSGSTSTTTTTTLNTTTKTTTTTTAPPTTTQVSTTTATGGHWWDSLGKPQYGGTTTLRIYQNVATFDTYYPDTLFTIQSAWQDRLFANDWTVDPAVFSYKIQFRSTDFVKGQLALSWEFSDPSTFVVHLRQGVAWQNIPPANGREFVASDVVFHYNRTYGLGGFPLSPEGVIGVNGPYKTLISVTATDKYTVVFKWGTPNPEFILETLLQVSNSVNCLENPEAVALWGNVNDWHHAIGTGPFILTDFVSSSSATLTRNPNYYGFDERYPQNHLPYIDTLKILVIPDNATALAGLRTGKIDIQDGVAIQDVQSLQKTNPELLLATNPSLNCVTISPRVDLAPYTDIRVRKALQMALNLPELCTSYYIGHALSVPSSLTSNYLTGWGYPYDQWPQDLKDEYAYNPTGAKKLLADAGYPNGFTTTLIADNASDLNLMQVVKSYFAAIGVTMNIQTVDSPTFATLVQANHKNDGLAIRSAGNLGLTYEPITQLNRLRTGSSSNFGMISDPINDAFYTKGLAASSISDVKQILMDANKYVTQQHFVIALLQYDNFALYQPWLKGYNGQLYGAGLINPSGLPMLSFYQSRFWIDQNLKKSMGH